MLKQHLRDRKLSTRPKRQTPLGRVTSCDGLKAVLAKRLKEAEKKEGTKLLGAVKTLATGQGTRGTLLQSIKSAGAEDVVKCAMARKNATVSMKEMGQRLLDALKEAK
jgi:hypothetical protein